MFNLEKSITEWRKQMLAAGINKPVLVDELESHLREEIGRLTKSGLTPPDAFEAAVQQIGNAVVLKKEFKKINGISIWLERLMIVIAAVFLAFIIFWGGATVVMCFTSFGERLMAAIAMACTVAVAYGWRYAVPFLPVIAGARRRNLIGIACIGAGFIVGQFWANEIPPFFAPDKNCLAPAAVFWAAFIIAVFACLGLGLCLDEKAREALGMRKRRSYV